MSDQKEEDRERKEEEIEQKTPEEGESHNEVEPPTTEDQSQTISELERMKRNLAKLLATVNHNIQLEAGTSKQPKYGRTVPYGCEICGKTYTAKSSIKRHIIDKHLEPKLGCDVCSKKFSRLELLKEHLCDPIGKYGISNKNSLEELYAEARRQREQKTNKDEAQQNNTDSNSLISTPDKNRSSLKTKTTAKRHTLPNKSISRIIRFGRYVHTGNNKIIRLSDEEYLKAQRAADKPIVEMLKRNGATVKTCDDEGNTLEDGIITHRAIKKETEVIQIEDSDIDDEGDNTDADKFKDAEDEEE